MSAGELLQRNPEAEMEALEIDQLEDKFGMVKTLYWRPENGTTFVKVEDTRKDYTFQVEVADMVIPEGKTPGKFALECVMAYSPDDYRG